VAVLDRVPVEDIRTRAAEVDPAKLVLALLALPFLIVGWLAGKVWTVLWAVTSWSVAAVQVGWFEARKPREGVE
jgi:hypothetical protein